MRQLFSSTILFIWGIVINPVAFGQTDSSTIYKIITNSKTSIAFSESEYQKKIDSLQKELLATKQKQSSEKNKTAAQKKKIDDAIQKIAADIKEVKQERIKSISQKKFEAGKLAISAMKGGVTILNFTYKFLDLDQTINLSTSLWSDSSFRNFFNRLEDWGSVAGLLITTLSLTSMDGSSDQLVVAGAGLGITGLTKALGTLFGVNQKKFREKTERIDLSIRAYDDLLIRNKQLLYFIENNKSFEDSLKSYEVRFLSSSFADTTMSFVILSELLDQYKLILMQIPIYLDEISSVSNGYINNEKRYSELPMKDIFDKVNKKCSDLKSQYNKEVKPLLDVSPDIKKILFFSN